MSDETNYSDILNRSWNDIPQPKVLPEGSWRLKGRNASYMAPKDDKDGKVLFFYTAQEPMDDVDASELTALGDGYDFENNDIVFTIYINRSKDWDSVRNHLAKHGVQAHGTIKETLAEFKNTEIVAFLGTRQYTTNAGETKTDNSASQFAEVQ